MGRQGKDFQPVCQIAKKLSTIVRTLKKKCIICGRVAKIVNINVCLVWSMTLLCNIVASGLSLGYDFSAGSTNNSLGVGNTRVLFCLIFLRQRRSFCLPI